MTSASKASSASSSISAPATRMRSLKRTRCGLVKAWTVSPAASIAARSKATVEPLPLVPATWKIGGSWSCGRPSRSSSAAIRSSPSRSPAGEVMRKPVELRLDAGMRRAREVGHQAAALLLRREIGDEQRQPVAQLAARDDHVDHPVLEQIFGALEAFGQFLADGLLDHPLAGKADQRAGLGQLDVAEHRVGSGNPAGGRVGEDDDIGQAGFLQFGPGDGRARHLHQAQYAFLHPRAAGRGEQDIGAIVLDRGLDPGDERGADRNPHRSAHEGEILDPDDRPCGRRSCRAR